MESEIYEVELVFDGGSEKKNQSLRINALPSAL